MNSPINSKSITVGALGFTLIVILSWRPLFFQGQIPVDGNMTRMGYPNWALSRNYAATGTPPLWNPFRNMGEPFLADPQTMAAYPFQWLLIAAKTSFLNFMRLWILIHTLIAALFMSLLAWRWYHDPWAAAAAALAASLNGCFTSRVTLPNHFASAAYLPMVLYFTDRRSPIFLGVAFALQWLAGFPPFTILACLLSLCFALLQGYPGLVNWIAGSSIGIALAAFQFFPFLEFLQHSTRSFMLSGSSAVVYSQPIGQLIKIWLLPQWFAFSSHLIGDQAIVSSYVGPIAFALSVWGILRGKKLEKTLATLLGMSLILSLGGALPGYRQLPWLHLFRFPSNWGLISVGCVALLAASGISYLRSNSIKKIALGLLAADLLVFAQYIRVAWLPPALLEEPPKLALNILTRSFPARIYHPPFLTELYVNQSLKGIDDYVFMRESLMPSYGTAFGVREVKSYQALALKSVDLYQRRLLAGGMNSPLAKWAGISTAITLRRGAVKVGSETVNVLQLASPEKPVFMFNRQAGDRIYSVQQRPGYCSVDLACLSPECLVVFSEMDYPGWRVLVDNARYQHEQFEKAFLAARISSGRHRVVFQFTSQTFQRGLILSASAILFLIIFLLAKTKSCVAGPAPTLGV